MSARQRVIISICFGAFAGGAWAASLGWQPPRQLAFSPQVQERLSAPAVYTEQDHVMVVYHKRELWFIESMDGGKTWTQPVSISQGPVLNRVGLSGGENLAGVSRDFRPAVIADRSYLLVAWHAFDKGNYRILMARRPKGATSWESPAVLVDPGRDNHAFNPRFVLTSQGLYLFWYNVLEAPRELGATTPILSTDMLKKRGQEGPAGINMDIDFRDVGKDTRTNAIGIRFGMINVGYQIAPETVRNPGAGLSVPSVFEAFTDQFGNLYCAMTENLQVVTRKYSPAIKVWNPIYDYRFDLNYFFSAHYLGNRLQLVRVESRPTKVFVELVGSYGSAAQRVSDPVDLNSIPSFWMDRELTHVVWSRTEGDTSWIAYVRSDRTPPTSRFTKPEGREIAQVVESPFWINWEGSDDFSPAAGLMYRYRFTGGGWSDYKRIAGIKIIAPPDRPEPYDVEVQAVDEAGNPQVAAVKLKFDVSGVAPETLITQGRQEVVVRRRQSFAWVGQDNTDGPAVLRYSYQLDDQPPTDWKEQTSVVLENLSEGVHTFQVRARDHRDNVDPSPAKFSFDVELGIECFFPAAPPVITKESSYTLKWDCRDETPDVVKFAYRRKLDVGPWSEAAPEPQFTFANLVEGHHAVAVRAEDPIGNTSKDDLTHAFTVDLTPPRTAPIDKLVLNQGYEPIVQLAAEDNFTPSTRMTYRYSLDKVNWQPTPDRELLVMAGKPVRFWSLGYKVYVSSVDEAGNADPNPAAVDFTFLGRDPIAAYTFLGGAGAVLLAILGMTFSRIMPRRRSPALAGEELFGEERRATEAEGGAAGGGDYLSAPASGEKKKPSNDDLFS